jgi:hypothetical protein
MHLRWRATAQRRFVVAATLLFTLALLAGEYGLCFGGYVLAIELVSPAPRAGAEGLLRGLVARAARLLPFAAPAAAYLIAHRRLGYGVIGSGLYADPFNARMTVTFFQLAPRRFANLLARTWLTLDDAAGPLVLGSNIALLLLMAVAIALLVRRTASRLDEPSRSTVAWAAPGALLVLVPALAVIPGTRMLGTTMLGVSALVAVLFSEAWASLLRRDAGGLALLSQLTGLALGAAHLLHGPMVAWAEGVRVNFMGWEYVARVTALDERLRSKGARDIVVLRGMPGSLYLPFALPPSGGLPKVRFLSPASHVLALRRDARTIDLMANGVAPGGPANVFQDAFTRAPAGGDVLRMPDVTVTILESGPQLLGPHIVRFQFAKDVESSGALWVTEDLPGFRDVVLPDPGFGATFDL